MINKNFRVAKRYARALFSLAQEHHITEKSYEDMKYLSSVFAANKELQAILKSPVIREGKKSKILLSIFENHIHPLNMKYILIVVRKQRALLLYGIARAFLSVYKEAMGIELVKVTTAVPMDQELREKVIDVARALTPLQIEFDETIDPGIIGGFILNLGDRQYDASIRRKLSVMKKQFTF